MDFTSHHASQPHWPPPSSPPSLIDNPVLLLVYFHKAVRSEFEELHRLAFHACESKKYSVELAVELRRRFEFLKLFFKYHCVAAEDEVIFLALDTQVKNIASMYALEHMGFEGLFDAIFNCLNAILEAKKDVPESFQELVSCIGTAQRSISEHMEKEEQQVIPLSMQHFSSKVQAKLLWQFLCSVPVMFLEDFLPWTISFLSSHEQVEFIECIKKIVPKEELLQEVVESWLEKKKLHSDSAYSCAGKEIELPSTSWRPKSRYKIDISESSCEEILNLKKARYLESNMGDNPVDGLFRWHGVIEEELKELLNELKQMKLSTDFSNLSLLVVMLRFLVDILVFYSTALEKFFYPVVNKHCIGQSSPSNKRLPTTISFEGLQQLLYCNIQDSIPLSKSVGKLCRELESFLVDVRAQFSCQEMEVFPIISKTCSLESQQHILYKSLQILPLGLLKCVVLWFPARLSEQESKMLLNSIKKEELVFNRSFASLLHEWIRIGCSGKTSVRKFRRNLQKLFKSRCSLLSDKMKEDTRCTSLLSAINPPIALTPVLTGEISTRNDSSSCVYHASNSYNTLYSSGINLHVFFPGTVEKIGPFPKLTTGNDCANSVHNEPRPIDLVFIFHNALKKNLEGLVYCSAKLDGNFGFLNDFYWRLHLIRFLYEIHNEAEVEVAFPALEAKEKLQNISHSYFMDHKLEIQYFNTVSFILGEISQSQPTHSSTNLDKMNQMILKRHQLCMNLHEMCKSLRSQLLGHISREESELWPTFQECFSDKEQERMIGSILGRTRSEVLQDMIPWLRASLSAEEYNIMMSLWCKVARKTMFNEWLDECWEKREIDKVAEPKVPSTCAGDPLDIVTQYLVKVLKEPEEAKLTANGTELPLKDSASVHAESCGICDTGDKFEDITGDQVNSDCVECKDYFDEVETKTSLEDAVDEIHNHGQTKRLLKMSQKDLEVVIRRVYRDSSLDPQQKSYIAQNLLMSRWIVRQQIYNAEEAISSSEGEIQGLSPSYRDPNKKTFGCEHYKRNCKLVAPCCNKLYTCRRCHDEVAGHLVDRKSIKKMMCMKCLVIQPIGATCSTASCNSLSMARYYCKICKLHDDERDIYHCPYCNLCRLGKGLGIDYFHCMNCNACLAKSLSNHICREKSLEDNCAICHENMFTSCEPVKSLLCGHLMHSKCFQEYTIMHYTCPICSKTLGDMKVYFDMLDAWLAEEKPPDEYAGKTQVILCHDCEKRGDAPFHWLHHKCPHCGSYNTRVL